MLTRSILASPSLRVAEPRLDPSRVARSAGSLATHDLPRLVRRADVPRRLETGVGAASDAIRGAVDRVPGRRRRNPWRPAIPGLAIVTVLAVLAITSWWVARGAALSTARELDDELDDELDEDALERATDEGMPPAADALAASGGTAPDGQADAFGASLDA